MATRLENANTSEEIRMAGFFRKRSDKQDLLVLVEGDDDIPFWTKLFADVQDKYNVDVHTLKIKKEEDADEVDRKGKEALMTITNLGPNKVVAVDADLDLLLPAYHTYSHRLRSDPYVISTQYYSMENHKLYPDLFSVYIQRMTGMLPISKCDARQILEEFSCCLAPFFQLLLVYEEERKKEENLHVEMHDITIKGLKADIGKLPFIYDRMKRQERYGEWKALLSKKYVSLLNLYSGEIIQKKCELWDRGIEEKDYWKYMQGHSLTVFAFLVLKHFLECNKQEYARRIKQEVTIIDKRKAVNDLHIRMGWTEDWVTLLDKQLKDYPEISPEDTEIDTIRKKINNIWKAAEGRGEFDKNKL